jgi:hypothetical protein
MFRFRRSDLERLVVPAAEKRIAELQVQASRSSLYSLITERHPQPLT